VDPALTPELQNPAANILDVEPHNFADLVSDPAPHEDADQDPGLEPQHVADPDSESSVQENSSHRLYDDIEDEFLQFNSFRIHEDVSKSYKNKLLPKQPTTKTVSF
jgi:hypothetical protein